MGISDAAESVGFRTHGLQVTLDELLEQEIFPCILHWNQSHFVVAYGVKKSRGFLNRKSPGLKVLVSDPASGLLEFDKEEFIRQWISTAPGKIKKGIALALMPSPTFYTDRKTVTTPSFLEMFKYLVPYKSLLVQLVFAIVTASIIGLMFPFLTQSIVDHGVSLNDISFIGAAVIAQFCLLFGQVFNEYIRNVLTLHVTSRVSIAIISDFLAKLMKLPITFFESKATGDLMQRVDDHQRIQIFLTNTSINILFSVLTVGMYGIVLAFFSPAIFLVFLAGSILYLGWTTMFLSRRKEVDYNMFHHVSASQSNLIQMINGIQEIKLNNYEKQKRWEWERIQVKIFKTSLKALFINQNQQSGGAFIDQTKNLAITFLSANLVVSGQISIGMMMAIQYIIGQLNVPVQKSLSYIQSAQDAKISLERLSEISALQAEDAFDDTKISDRQVSKSILLDGVDFKYLQGDGELVLNGVTCRIPADSVTAIVGSSGSGKTTLIKLLLSFYKPTLGEIKLDSMRLAKMNESVWRKQCGVVLQDGFIFADSILNNITVGDEKTDYVKLESALEIACLKEFVESVPMGWNARIGGEGLGLSTGEKQRLLIARAVYKDPDYLFFDEATNALDAKNEANIMRNLQKFFSKKTVVIVAHRLSTVKNADQIIVLEKGKIVEMGKHDELVHARGFYFSLIKDQLELGLS